MLSVTSTAPDWGILNAMLAVCSFGSLALLILWIHYWAAFKQSKFYLKWFYRKDKEVQVVAEDLNVGQTVSLYQLNSGDVRGLMVIRDPLFITSVIVGSKYQKLRMAQVTERYQEVEYDGDYRRITQYGTLKLMDGDCDVTFYMQLNLKTGAFYCKSAVMLPKFTALGLEIRKITANYTLVKRQG